MPPAVSQVSLDRHVLVTGGAGFIGSHLCDLLLQRGHYVTCMDNLYTGSIRNIRPLLNHPRFQFIEHDVRRQLHIEDRLDQIYHLACPASPQHYQRDPIGTMTTCVVGTMNVLDLGCQKSARVLQASTSEVYGDPEIHPQPESYAGHVNTIGPRACYDEGKRAAEALMFDYHRVHGLQIKLARIFNTYGPRMLENDGRVISNFIIQALRGEPITVYGTGQQTRSFCFVDDLVRGLNTLMESPASITGPFNLGNPEELSVETIAREIIARTASKSILEFKPLPQDDPKRRKPLIDEAEKRLGWRPRIPLSEGLEATIAYFAMQVASVGSARVVGVGSRSASTTARLGLARKR
ncbi:MAG TPA: UDP-glucuronic acid decarboxylase family protein [Bradyrhizobium sp.]|uniref:UDP-glucuronic acid decarboxylase family protein n=1 Tax=Bradyrhizobium sp. TaxID=376 RepID=UPI002D7E6440|nr:UDP-glucuronic acid decarboxylase family protein [Bradyrhizobium sp.]HET7889736.1 UDP-glucuronic acid decarboxylase family protein [Bradyrhizobium sp.]